MRGCLRGLLARHLFISIFTDSLRHQVVIPDMTEHAVYSCSKFEVRSNANRFVLHGVNFNRVNRCCSDSRSERTFQRLPHSAHGVAATVELCDEQRIAQLLRYFKRLSKLKPVNRHEMYLRRIFFCERKNSQYLNFGQVDHSVSMPPVIKVLFQMTASLEFVCSPLIGVDT